MLDRLPNCPLLELNGWTRTTCLSQWPALQVEIRRVESPEFPMWCLSSKNLISISFSCFGSGGRPFKEKTWWKDIKKLNFFFINIFWVSRLFLEGVCQVGRCLPLISDPTGNCWALRSLEKHDPNVPLMEEMQHHLGRIKHCNEGDMCRHVYTWDIFRFKLVQDFVHQ